MKNIMFKNLIEDIYHIWKTRQNPGLCCLVYGAISTYGFSEIKDIHDFTNCMNPDMLHIQNKKDEEVDVYEYNLLNYKIEDSKLSLVLRNKKGDVIINLA